MPDKIVNHFVLADGSTAKYDAGALLNLDDTVSLAGYAPDAKAVGDRLTDVENFLPTGIVGTLQVYSESKNFVSLGGSSVSVNNGEFVTTSGSTTYKVYIVPCNAGDAFIVNGAGGSGSARLWGFIGSFSVSDTTAPILSACSASQSASGLHDNLLIAPENSAFAIFQINNGGMVSKIGNGLVEYVENVVDNHDLEDYTFSSGMINTYNGTYVNITNGTIGSEYQPTYVNTVVPCTAGDVFIVNGAGGSGSARLWGFLPDIVSDGQLAFISVASATESAEGLSNSYLTAPQGAKWAIFNMKSADVSTNKVQKTIGLLGKIAENTVQNNTKNDNNHIRFLVFGNSYGCDFISYVPFILKNMGVTCEIYFYERDALTLENLYKRWESTDETDTETDVDHTGTYGRYLFYIDTTRHTSWQVLERKSAKQCVELGGFDFITLQQWSRFSIDQSTYEPWLSLIIDLIRQSIDKETPLVWTEVCTRSTADDRASAISAFENAVYKKHPFEYFIPYGTAIFNARTNSTLSGLGDYEDHNLWCADGVHLQDGIPRYIASLGAVEAICRKFFPNKTVLYDKTRPSTDLVNSWNVLQKHLPVVGVTEDNCLLAQKSAIMANIFPFTITSIDSTPVAPIE